MNMKKKKVFVISFIGLFIVVLIGLMMNKETFSVEQAKYAFENTKEVTLGKEDLQKLVVRTAKSFYYNREYIQYKTENDDDLIFSHRDLTVSPEELNINNTVYMDDASFIFSVYLNALAMNLSDESVNLESGVGFSIDNILKIIESYDERLVFESDQDSQQEQVLFATKYLNELELGDIIVYTKDQELYLALYIGDDDDGNLMCIYLYGEEGKSGIYTYNVSEYLFPNNKFMSDDAYYAIIRPINSLSYNSLDKTTLEVPVSSLARVDDVYVRRYTDVGTDNVYRGEVINYTIEIFNESSETVNVSSISDVLDSYLIFVGSKDGKYDVSNKSIVWNNVMLNAGDSQKFTYTVKVAGENEVDSSLSDDTVSGKFINANNARVLFTGDTYLVLNSIKYTIANKYIDEQKVDLQETYKEINKIDNKLIYESNGIDYKTRIMDIGSNYLKLDDLSFYSFLYYNALEVDFAEIMNEDSIRNSLFTLGENGYYTRNTVNPQDELANKINNMVVSNLYGGVLLNDSSKTKIFGPIINGEYTYTNLVSGDIIIYWTNSGIQNSYLYLENVIDEEKRPMLVTFNSEGIYQTENVSQRIEDRVLTSDIYVVLRPSMIFDIKLKSIDIDPVNVKVDGEKQLSFIKSPVNATINKISYSVSNKFSVDSETNVIKGLVAGTDTLTITFNDSLEKVINVVVSKDIYDFQVVTNYEVDEENNNKIIYVGNDTSVETILSKINFNMDGYEKKIYNNSHEEITDKITDKAVLEISLNGELVEQYMVISFSLETSGNEVIVSDENIITYVSIGTSVSDLRKKLSFNGNNVDVEFYDKMTAKIDDNHVLATGDYLVFKVTDKIEHEYQIAVMGDVSGNGVFNGNDVVLTRRHIVGWVNPQTSVVYELSGVYVYAMDFSMNGVVNGNDVSAMRRKLVN